MENNIVKGRYSKVFYYIWIGTLGSAFKSPALNIVGSLYFLISTLIMAIISYVPTTSIKQGLIPVSNVFYIFSIFLLFLMIILTSLHFFHNHKKIGLLKLEQREGVPLYISYFARIFNTYIFTLIYQIAFIVATHLFFSNSWNKQTMINFNGFNLIDLQPLVSIVIIAIVSLFVITLNSIGATVWTLILAIIYSLSPITSIGIVNVTDSNSSNENKALGYVLSNVELGKKFYEEVKNKKDVYDENYLSIIKEIKKKNTNGYNIDINSSGDIYHIDFDPINSVFIYGIIPNKQKIFKEYLDLYNNWNFFKNYISPIEELSKKVITVDNNPKYFDFNNSFFNSDPKTKSKAPKGDFNWSKVEKSNFSVYYEYLNSLLKEVDKDKNSLSSLISFAKKNIEQIIYTYDITKENNGNFLTNGSSIPLIKTKESNFGSYALNEKTNYMLSQLIWELLTYYNLSLDPALLSSNIGDSLGTLKKYANSSYNFFDPLLLSNHIYTILNYKYLSNKGISIYQNSYTNGTFDSKEIVKPYKVEFSNDENFLNVINKKTDSENYNHSLSYFKNGFKVEYKENINIQLMWVLYPIACLTIISLMGLVFIKNSRK